jgi:hypothetical protein
MDSNENILTYIRTNRTRYNRRAIDKRLGEQGYTFAEIEAAWQQVLSEGESAQQDQGIARGRSASSCTVPILVIFGFLLVVITNVGIAFDNFESSHDTGPTDTLLSFVNVGSVAVLVLVLAAMLLLSRRGWPPGKLVGLITAVAVVWYLVVAGSCFYGMSAY